MKVKLASRSETKKYATTSIVDSSADVKQFDDRLKQFQTSNTKNRERALALLNERHFGIRVGADYGICDQLAGDTVAMVQSEAEFKKPYRNIKYQLTKKRKGSLGGHWLDWSDRRSYPGKLAFKPDGAFPALNGDIDFNTWRGFRIKPKAGDWSLFRTHLKVNVCREVEKFYTYLWKYFCHMVQYPGRLPGAAHMYRGPQGTGKTIVYKMFELLFHKWNRILIEDSTRLVHHFNAHLVNKILVCADEALFVGDRSVIGKLKSKITAEEIPFEAKGFDVVQMDNFIRLIIISNEPHVLQVARDERRYFVLEVASTFAQQPRESLDDAALRRKAYFDPISRQMKHEGGAEAMLHDMLEEDLSDFDPALVPETPWLVEQKKLSWQPHEEWLDDCLTHRHDWFAGKPILKSLVYEKYVEYYRLNGHDMRYRYKDWQLGKFLKEIYPYVSTRPRINKIQQSAYLFPLLTEAREAFDMKTAETHGKLTVRIRK